MTPSTEPNTDDVWAVCDVTASSVASQSRESAVESSDELRRPKRHTVPSLRLERSRKKTSQTPEKRTTRERHTRRAARSRRTLPRVELRLGANYDHSFRTKSAPPQYRSIRAGRKNETYRLPESASITGIKTLFSSDVTRRIQLVFIYIYTYRL